MLFEPRQDHSVGFCARFRVEAYASSAPRRRAHASTVHTCKFTTPSTAPATLHKPSSRMTSIAHTPRSGALLRLPTPAFCSPSPLRMPLPHFVSHPPTSRLPPLFHLRAQASSPAATSTVISWNVNSLRALLRKDPLALNKLAQEFNPDVLCLQVSWPAYLSICQNQTSFRLARPDLAES